MYQVRELVAALTPKIEACREPLSGRHLAQAVYGLRGLSCGPRGLNGILRRLVAAVAEKVERAREPLDCGGIGMALCRRRFRLARKLCNTRALSDRVL